MIFSMTGFSSRTFSFQGQQFKVECKSLNHRFLDIKLRIPREWSALDAPLRSLIEKKIKRGSVDFWIERATPSTQSEVQLNMEQAEIAHEFFSTLKNRFSIADGITVRDIASFPDVITKGGAFVIPEAQWPEFQTLVFKESEQVLDELLKMRKGEGTKLKDALLLIVGQMRVAHGRLIKQREMVRSRVQEKTKKRIEQCFEATSNNDEKLRALMETRIAQEIVIALERMDIEEELTRYIGHIGQLEQTLKGEGPVGKKLDFLLQELNREINTLGNKSQDLEISQEVMGLKMGVEQLREQCLNLE